MTDRPIGGDSAISASLPCVWLVRCLLVGGLVVQLVGAGELVGTYFVWVIATCVVVCIMVGSGYSAWTYVREAQCLIFCLMHGMTVRLSHTVMTATSVTLFVRGGSDMSEVVLNCAGCGVSDAARVESSQTSGVVVCSACGEGVDVAHAFAHAPWCVLCGEDVWECVCVPFASCGECGREVDGYVCRVCAVCPEPAGYWAWDRETSREYLIGLERAAARESDPELRQALIAHHAVMTSALGMDEEGE